jgi:hypothetical protein
VFCAPTHACSCSVTQLNARDDAARVFKDATVVFEGEILSIEPAKEADLSSFSPDARAMITGREPVAGEITFRVLRQYKGVPQLEIRMYTGARDSAEPCQLRYHPGDRWLIYGFQKKDGKLYFTDCNRSIALDKAGADLRFARGEPATEEDLMPRAERTRLELNPELKETGATLRGSIRRFDRLPMGKALVTIWRLDGDDPNDRAREADQDANLDGTFVVRYLPPGTYFLSAEVIDWQEPDHFVGRIDRFTVKEHQVVTGLEIILDPKPMSEVRVHVESSEALGRPLEIELSDLDGDFDAQNPKLYPDEKTTTDVDSAGLAVLKGMQYVAYHLSVSNVVAPDGEAHVNTGCIPTPKTAIVDVDKPIVEITIHLQCKPK